MLIYLLKRKIELEKNLKLSQREINALQWAKFKKILEYAYHNVPFYTHKFKKASITPDDIRTPYDLAKIPLTTKEEIRKSKHSVISEEYDKERLASSRTSGSTGEPFTSYFDKKSWIILKFLSKYRARRACGVRLGFRMVNIEAYSQKKIKKMNSTTFLTDFILKKRFLSIYAPIEEHVAFYKKFKPDSLYFLASYGLALGEYIHKNNIPDLNLKMIFTSGEMLDPITKKKLEQYFKCPIYDIYGSTEVKEVSWEAPDKRGYYINDDLYLVEFVDKKGKRVKDGYEGDIAITSLENKGMPLIRYTMGDRGRAVKNNSGMYKFSCMRPDQGRDVDYFILKNGTEVSPYTLTSSIENIDGILQYQILQKSKTKTLVKIRKDNKYNAKTIPKIKEELANVLGLDMKIEVEVVNNIAREKSGKYKVVKNEVKK